MTDPTDTPEKIIERVTKSWPKFGVIPKWNGVHLYESIAATLRQAGYFGGPEVGSHVFALNTLNTLTGEETGTDCVDPQCDPLPVTEEAPDEYPIGSRWRCASDGEVFEVRGHDRWAGSTIIIGGWRRPDGTERSYHAYLKRPPGVLVPEPVFKPGDQVTWGEGVVSYTVLAAYLHPDTGETYIVTTLDPERAEPVNNPSLFRTWRLA